MTMKIKHAINDVQSMSHDGSKILQSLQNNYLPIVDIVVREAVQNSLDASIDGEESTNVDFRIGTFESENLAPLFEEVNELLIENYPGSHEYLAIMDKKTYGLTGDYASEDIKILDNSNFHKLVFGIGKNQSKEGAGGSWGYGKTSYFRMGVGIVLYYTRIREKEGYEERLIASIIEDPSKDNRLLKSNERGIAWWGEPAKDSDRIYPLTDTASIKNILSIFGLETYTGMETGTTVIIPYLNKLDHETVDRDAMRYPWENTYEDAISMAVQRWYFPRILNDNYSEKLGNSKLECRVNRKLIHQAVEFQPVFSIYQEIYNSALLGKPLAPNIKVHAVNLGRNALEDTKEAVGYIAFREVSREELKMTPPDNKPSGLAYLGVKDKSLIENSMPKVIGYCRKPGMVLEYSVNGHWANTNIALKENHILMGFFVPNSNALLAKSFQEADFPTLESYLRSIESSDHASWEDHVNITIVKRIRERTNQLITNAYQNDKDNEHTSATSGLSRKFGAMLLPPKNFGKTSSRGKEKGNGSGSGSKGTGKTRGSDVSVVGSLPKNEEAVEVMFKAFIKKQSVNHLFLQVLTQDQRIDLNTWIKVMDNAIPFPFSISGLHIQKINENNLNLSYKEYKGRNLSFSLSDDQYATLEVSSNLDEDAVIEGILAINILSNRYVPNIAIRTL